WIRRRGGLACWLSGRNGNGGLRSRGESDENYGCEENEILLNHILPASRLKKRTGRPLMVSNRGTSTPISRERHSFDQRSSHHKGLSVNAPRPSSLPRAGKEVRDLARELVGGR